MQRILFITNDQKKYKDFIMDVLNKNILINILDEPIPSVLLKLTILKYDMIILEHKTCDDVIHENMEYITKLYKNTKMVFITSYNCTRVPKGVDELVTEEVFLGNYREILGIHGIDFNKKNLYDTINKPKNGKKVVVIDDDEISLDILKNILTVNGYEVETFNNTVEVLEKFKRTSINNDVSLIILDLMMPIMDGYYLLKRIRQINGFEITPVLVATGRNDVESVERAIKYKVNGYIVKPYDSNLIVRKVEECTSQE